MRTPPFHYDFTMRTWDGPTRAFFETFRESNRRISTEEMMVGYTSKMLEWIGDNLGEAARSTFYYMALYERTGQRTYVVGPKVQQLFEKTTLKGIRRQLLNPQHESFYVAVADCPWKLWGGARTGWHQLVGIYVKFGRYMDSLEKDVQQGVNFFLWATPNEKSVNDADDAVFWYSVNLEECFAEGEGDLEEYFQKSPVMTDDKVKWDATIEAAGELEGTDYLDQQRETVRNVFRLVVNLVLYLCSDEPDISISDLKKEKQEVRAKVRRAKNPGKAKKLQRRLENMPETVITYIGPKIEREASSGGESGSHASPREHMVRPHWHHYWVGPKGNQTLALRWIHMYKRGSGKPERTVTKIREPM